jgi:DNA-binding response OmpR family regulator
MRTEKQKVLVVSHDTADRSTCVSAILPLGCHVLEAQDGQQGYEKFVREGAHLVISADEMPGLTGVEMVKKIRQKDSEVPVLLLSGGTSDHLEDEVTRLGGCKVLTKPFFPRQLRSVVEAALPRE